MARWGIPNYYCRTTYMIDLRKYIYGGFLMTDRSIFSRILVIGIIAIICTSSVFSLPDTFSVTTSIDGQTKTLVLNRYSVRTPDYWVRTWDSTNGYVVVHDELNGPTPYEVRTYRGYVSESPNERITAFIRPDNMLYAEGHHGKGRLWYAGPVDVSGIVGGSAIPAPQSSTTSLSAPVQEEPAPGDNLAQDLPEGPALLSVDPPHEPYLPPVGIYQCEAVYDVPSRMFDSWGSDVERAIAEAEYLFNKHDHFNVRDAKVHIPLSELVIRKEQFYFPADGAWSQFTSMLKSEWQSISRDWTGGVGFIHSNFPYNFSYAGGYAVGNNFYGGNPAYAINALYHENAHNWRANHFYYGVDTMSGSYPHHGEINAERVLYTREQEINIDGELAQVFDYPTPMHPMRISILHRRWSIPG